MAEAYLNATDWRIEGLRVSDEDGLIFPDFGSSQQLDPCMVDVEGYTAPKLTSRFFDYEFIYRAGDFADLTGGARKVLRKNHRHIKQLAPVYRPLSPKQAVGLFLEWLEGVEIYHDLDTTLAYLQTTPTNGLFLNDRLVGLNAADSNWSFVNYRYCFALPVERGLSEYMRVLFYQRLPAQTLVNDGGSLGNAGLERFKRKLLPAAVYRRYSWS
jgi:hypothetical protein